MFDLRTLYFTTACVCVCLAVVGIGKALTQRRDDWLVLCSVGNILLGLGFGANATAEGVSRFVSVSLANALTILGFAAFVLSARVLAERPPRLWICAPILLITIATVLLLGNAEATYGQRVGTLSLLFGLCELAAAREGVRIAARQGLRSGWGMALVFALTGAIMIARSGFAFAGALNNNASAHVALAIIGVTVVCARSLAMILVAAERRHQIWERRALHDPLTGALNRAGLAELSLKPPKSSFRSEVSVLVIDVDRFKAVNDTAGHDAGDALLCLVADTIRSELRKDDLLARQGGDEFVVWLPDESLVGALAVAERIRCRFEGSAAARHADIGPTLSIGVSSAPTGPLDLKTLLSQADQALYDSKHAGRNAVRGFAQAA